MKDVELLFQVSRSIFLVFIFQFQWLLSPSKGCLLLASFSSMDLVNCTISMHLPLLFSLPVFVLASSQMYFNQGYARMRVGQKKPFSKPEDSWSFNCASWVDVLPAGWWDTKSDEAGAEETPNHVPWNDCSLKNQNIFQPWPRRKTRTVHFKASLFWHDSSMGEGRDDALTKCWGQKKQSS